jgi:hypothetical protein
MGYSAGGTEEELLEQLEAHLVGEAERRVVQQPRHLSTTRVRHVAPQRASRHGSGGRSRPRRRVLGGHICGRASAVARAVRRWPGGSASAVATAVRHWPGGDAVHICAGTRAARLARSGRIGGESCEYCEYKVALAHLHL